MASAMEKALIKQGMPDKTARKEAKARIEAMKIAKIRKQEKKRLKKKILESMVWEDRENRIFERRETEPRVQQKGWHRERILRGTWDFENVNPANSTPGNGMSSEHHLSKYQPKMNIPPQSIEGTVDNEGEGGTLKEKSQNEQTFVNSFAEGGTLEEKSQKEQTSVNSFAEGIFRLKKLISCNSTPTSSSPAYSNLSRFYRSDEMQPTSTAPTARIVDDNDRIFLEILEATTAELNSSVHL